VPGGKLAVYQAARFDATGTAEAMVEASPKDGMR
jgi:hypothetical protein